jgi:hypothetical protein
MLPILSCEKAEPLFEISRDCWEGYVGEHETLPLVERFTEGFSERELRRAIALLLNNFSGYGRQALARQCCRFEQPVSLRCRVKPLYRPA